jgi:hypothetical protein
MRVTPAKRAASQHCTELPEAFASSTELGDDAGLLMPPRAEPFQMMVNAKELPTVEFADYTFVFAH